MFVVSVFVSVTATGLVILWLRLAVCVVHVVHFAVGVLLVGIGVPLVGRLAATTTGGFAPLAPGHVCVDRFYPTLAEKTGFEPLPVSVAVEAVVRFYLILV